MADQFADTIKQARQSGISDEDIVGDLQQHPEHGQKIKDLLSQGAKAKDIVDVMSEGAAPQPGMLKSIASGAADAFEGAGGGVANSVVGLRDVIAKGGKMLGLNVPDVPGVLREAGQTPEGASGMFKLGKGAEQTAEFFAPSGVVGDVSKAANFGGKAGAAAETLARVGLEGAASGAVTGVQTGGDTGASLKAATLTAAMTAPFASVNGFLKAVRPSTLYAPERFMSQIPNRFRGARADEIIGQAIDDGITIGSGGLKKAAGIERAGQNTRDALIAQHGNDLIDLNTVMKPLQDFRVLAESLGETGAVRQIDNRILAIQKSHGYQPGSAPGTITVPGPNPQATLTPAGMPRTINTPAIPSTPAKITISEAQGLKDFAQSLAAPMYEKANESVSTQKIRQLLADGFKKGIEEAIPEVQGMNRSIQNTKIIRQAISDYIDSNPSLVNMHTVFWAMVNPKAAFLMTLAQNPRMRSTLAVLAHSDALTKTGATAGKLAGSQVQHVFPSMPQAPTQ